MDGEKIEESGGGIGDTSTLVSELDAQADALLKQSEGGDSLESGGTAEGSLDEGSVSAGTESKEEQKGIHEDTEATETVEATEITETVETTETVEATEDTETDDDGTPDPNLTPVENKRIKDLHRKMTIATTEAAKMRKQGEIDKVENEELRRRISQLETLINKVGDMPVADKQKEVEKEKTKLDVSKDLEEIKKELPEMSAPLEKIFKTLTQEIDSLNAQLNSVGAKVGNVEASSAQEIHFQKIQNAFPNFREIATSEKFGAFKESVNSSYRKFIDNTLKQGTAEEVIDMLRDFEASDFAEIKEEGVISERKKKLQLAKKQSSPQISKTKNINPGPGKHFSLSNISTGMSVEAFEKMEKDIDEAMKARTLVS